MAVAGVKMCDFDLPLAVVAAVAHTLSHGNHNGPCGPQEARQRVYLRKMGNASLVVELRQDGRCGTTARLCTREGNSLDAQEVYLDAILPSSAPTVGLSVQ